MQDELFDVVDARDHVTGTAARAEVHRRGLRHRAAHVLVFNAAGMLYLQRRAACKDCSPGLWDTSAAGHLASGEAYDDAARREVHEELGLDPAPPLRRLFKIEAGPETGNEFVWVYAGHTARAVTPDPVEIAEGRWVSREELDTWLRRAPQVFTAAFRFIWARLTTGGAGWLPADPTIIAGERVERGV